MARIYLRLVQNNVTLCDDPALLERDAIWAFVSNAYWARTRAREQHERALDHSLCLGLYDGSTAITSQIGFARVITDFAITAHIADVYVLEAYRGRGLGKWLMQSILAHPELTTVRRFTLNTDDAHSLYAQFGFQALGKPAAMMELWRGGTW